MPSDRIPEKTLHSVLFVCSANQCRSPMAEVLFTDLVNQNGKPPADWRIASAGVWAYSGMPATSTAVTAMRERGLELKGHRSQGISGYLLKQYNLILCMTLDHKQSMSRNFPEHAHKIFLLSEMIERDGEIDDPVGLSERRYQSTADEIMDILTNGFDKIYRLSG
ncbi:MAG: protein arginine phosphatase [Chloroflexota bacterium]|nr:protein arginine phosphatase [Chloroflexota bacterium]